MIVLKVRNTLHHCLIVLESMFLSPLLFESVKPSRLYCNCLKLLWELTQQVSDEGDVLYVFPKDYRSSLTSKSLRMKYEPLLEKLKVSSLI
jgi:hypothetical protein